jgi:hypothetical protein
LPQRLRPFTKTKTSKKIFLVLVLVLLVLFFTTAYKKTLTILLSVASANRPASARLLTPSLAPSVHCDTKQTIDRGDSIIDANPPFPWFLGFLRKCVAIARCAPRKEKGKWNQKKIPNSSNRLVHSKKEATELIYPRYLLTER